MVAVTRIACVFLLSGCGADATGSPDGASADVADTRVDGASDAIAFDVSDGADTSDGSDTSTPDTTADSATVNDTGASEVTVEPEAGWFSEVMPWDRPVAGLAPHERSDAMITALRDRGGWGNTDTFQIDFSITVLAGDDATPLMSWEPNGDFYEGDCDEAPVPVPAGGALEGEEGYVCHSDGDCHLIVRTPTTLYEMWRANIIDGEFDGGCLAIWDLGRSYPESLRGEGCTSADAAGLPIAPLLFTADEVAAGEIAHAIRFILPNTRIAHRQYVRPGTHATGAASAEVDGMPYGVRLRLRADFPLDDLPNEAARVVARALQTYGMILADGGQIALTAASDRDAVNKWADLIEPRDLSSFAVEDFDVVDMGEIYDWDGGCSRN